MKIFYDETIERVDIADERYYTNDKINYYPSINFVLNDYPKGSQYETWLKDVGHNSQIIIEKAFHLGTTVHNMIEEFLKGNELRWFSDTGKELYTYEQWGMFHKFVDFFKEWNPITLAIEQPMINEELRIGCTLDYICRIGDKTWLIDHKTSKAIHENNWIQLAVNAFCWNHDNPDYKIDNIGIMWLRSATRGRDKQGKKIQGAGWQLKEMPGQMNEYIDTYKHLRHIFDKTHPNQRPKNYNYDNIVSIKLLEDGKKG